MLKPGEYPPHRRDSAACREILDRAQSTGYVSCDLEYTQREEPIIASLSAGWGAGQGICTSIPWSSARGPILEAVDRGLHLAGHAFITADRPVIAKATGRELPLGQIDDTMVLHYLCNADFCKGVAKSEDDLDPKRGTGLLDLWTMSSIYTGLPQWKRCRGTGCYGPCPDHDPAGYNAVDSIAVDFALPNLRREMVDKRIPDSLVRHINRLSALCRRMEDQQILIDMKVVAAMEAEMEEKKDALFGKRRTKKSCGVCGRRKQPGGPCKKCTQAERPTVEGEDGRVLGYTWIEDWDAPFNPRSSAASSWFESRGIYLRDTTKDSVGKALARLERQKNPDPEVLKWLRKWHEYKDAGKGLSAWFDASHVNALGFASPRFIACATSTGRLASSGPNFQNIPKRGWGKKVRRAVVPRDPSLQLVEADSRQLELRMVLWDAGVSADYGPDAFKWLAFEGAPEVFGAFEAPRDIAKSVSHAGSLMEGLKVLYSNDLDDDYIKRTVAAGALVVYPDWEYHGGVVAFTGVNLARRLFGDETWESRRKALEVQEAYFKRFPEIRKWQRLATEAGEAGWVRDAVGFYLTLRGSPEDKAKISAAVRMQGQSARYIQERMLDFERDGDVPLIQAHDALIFERDVTWDDHRCYEFMQRLAAPSKMFPGFACPIVVTRGPNWYELKEVEV